MKDERCKKDKHDDYPEELCFGVELCDCDVILFGCEFRHIFLGIITDIKRNYAKNMIVIIFFFIKVIALINQHVLSNAPSLSVSLYTENSSPTIPPLYCKRTLRIRGNI